MHHAEAVAVCLPYHLHSAHSAHSRRSRGAGCGRRAWARLLLVQSLCPPWLLASPPGHHRRGGCHIQHAPAASSQPVQQPAPAVSTGGQAKRAHAAPHAQPRTSMGTKGRWRVPSTGSLFSRCAFCSGSVGAEWNRTPCAPGEAEGKGTPGAKSSSPPSLGLSFNALLRRPPACEAEPLPNHAVPLLRSMGPLLHKEERTPRPAAPRPPCPPALPCHSSTKVHYSYSLPHGAPPGP